MKNVTVSAAIIINTIAPKNHPNQKGPSSSSSCIDRIAKINPEKRMTAPKGRMSIHPVGREVSSLMTVVAMTTATHKRRLCLQIRDSSWFIGSFGLANRDLIFRDDSDFCNRVVNIDSTPDSDGFSFQPVQPSLVADGAQVRNKAGENLMWIRFTEVNESDTLRRSVNASDQSFNVDLLACVFRSVRRLNSVDREN